jgi:hypothetical protein
MSSEVELQYRRNGIVERHAPHIFFTRGYRRIVIFFRYLIETKAPRSQKFTSVILPSKTDLTLTRIPVFLHTTDHDGDLNSNPYSANTRSTCTQPPPHRTIYASSVMSLPFESQLPPIAGYRPASTPTPRNTPRSIPAERICFRDGGIKHTIRTWMYKGSGYGLQEHGQ